MVVLAELGTIRIWDNIIRRSYAGIWLTDTTAAALTDLGGTFGIPGGLKDRPARSAPPSLPGCSTRSCSG